MPNYSITNGTVQNNGTEQEFLSAFIKQFMVETAFSSLHSLECKIGTTTNTNPPVVSLTKVETAAEVDNQLDSVFNDTAKKPTFSFKIDDCAVLTFTRPYTISGTSSAVMHYNVTAEFFDTAVTSSTDNDITLRFTSSTFTGNRWIYQIVWNAKVIYVVFGNYNETFPLSTIGETKVKSYQAFCYQKNSDKVSGLHAGGTLYDNSNRILSLKNRLSYVNSSNPTDIETIQNKAVVCNSDKVLVADDIWDSSYNGVLMLPLNVVNNQNNQCVYLNNYTVIPLLSLN